MASDFNLTEGPSNGTSERSESMNQGFSDRAAGETGSSGRVRARRGFAAMDPQTQRAIAAKGGRAAHIKGTAHEFTSEEARIAGRKGGEASRGGRRSELADSGLERQG